MKTELKNRQQLLAILAILGVALLAGDKLLFQPMVKTWKDRNAAIAKLEKQVLDGTTLLEREANLRERWESMRKGTLPSDASAAEQQLLKAFDKWSRDARISVSSIKPQWKRVSTDDYSLLECRVDASGSLSALTRFLYDIEKDEMALKIESLEITSRDDRGQQLGLGLLVTGLRLQPMEAK